MRFKSGRIAAAVMLTGIAGHVWMDRAAAQASQAATFADLADLALASPVVLQAVITKTSKLDADEAPGVAPGHARLLVEADVRTVLAAAQAAPRTIRYQWEGPVDARGKAPKLKGQTVMLFLRPVPGMGRAETGIRNLYLGSASAHPGGGVHGAPGMNAARAALAHARLRRPFDRLKELGR